MVIEGLIGVGKTSLCRLLEQERGARLILEPHVDNPFLEPFYREPERYALPVQMFFLLSRWRQVDHIRQMSLFEPWIVSDYVFDKDRLFAEKTLSPSDFDVYDRFAGTLRGDVPTPDLVVVLHASNEQLLGRIEERGIAGEDRITLEYLEDLRERYTCLWDAWRACPVLHVDTSALDYVTDPAAQAWILKRIDEALVGDTAPTAPGSVSDREAQADLFGARA